MMAGTALLMVYVTLGAFSNGPRGLEWISLPGLFVVTLMGGSGISQSTGKLIAVGVNLLLISIPFLVLIWAKSERLMIEKNSRIS
jgi:hypothetical protein